MDTDAFDIFLFFCLSSWHCQTRIVIYVEHVLSSCSTALEQWRYRWRHDNVHRETADWLEGQRKKERRSNLKPGHINFVRPGEPAKAQSTQKSSILDGTQDWNMSVDLGKKLVFPTIAQTTVRPDIVVSSHGTKKLIIIELTVPWESRCDDTWTRHMRGRKLSIQSSWNNAVNRGGTHGFSQLK